MAEALQEKHQHPKITYAELSKRFHIPPTTISDRFNGRHADRAASASQALPAIVETALVDKINKYAKRGTLLSPRHVHELAEAVSGDPLGVELDVALHSTTLPSNCLSILPISRTRTNTPETKRAFCNLVSSTESYPSILTRLYSVYKGAGSRRWGERQREEGNKGIFGEAGMGDGDRVCFCLWSVPSSLGHILSNRSYECTLDTGGRDRDRGMEVDKIQ